MTITEGTTPLRHHRVAEAPEPRARAVLRVGVRLDDQLLSLCSRWCRSMPPRRARTAWSGAHHRRADARDRRRRARDAGPPGPPGLSGRARDRPGAARRAGARADPARRSRDDPGGVPRARRGSRDPGGRGQLACGQPGPPERRSEGLGVLGVVVGVPAVLALAGRRLARGAGRLRAGVRGRRAGLAGLSGAHARAARPDRGYRAAGRGAGGASHAGSGSARARVSAYRDGDGDHGDVSAARTRVRVGWRRWRCRQHGRHDGSRGGVPAASATRLARRGS